MEENVTPAVLYVEDFEEREIQMVDYIFFKTIDAEGQIVGIPRGGRITVKVKARNDGNNQLMLWMLDEHDARNMKITFYNTVNGNVIKVLEGTECYCVNYKEDWEDEIGHSETVEIVCQTLTIGSVTYENPWK